MTSAVPSDKSRGNAARLPAELNSLGLNPDKSSSGRPTTLRGEHQESGTKHWTLTSEGFPPGVTVDELKKYRRRRQVDDIKPKDNLQPEEGSLKSYTSEYKRRYRAYDTGDVEAQPSKADPPAEKQADEEGSEEKKEPVRILKRPQSNLHLTKDVPMEGVTEKNSQYIPYGNTERRKLLRKSTALKPEGELFVETEVRSQFRVYDNPEKVIPIRRPPSLKLEGEFETMTSEQKEKFVTHFLDERPVLRKKNTLLKMEGDFNFLTEKQVSYVEHGPNERPRPRKRSTSLKLDGEVEFFPEYRSSFVEFPRSRPITYKPAENLRNEGEIESQTETKTKFVYVQQNPVPVPVRPSNNLHVEGGLEIRPEYKENFIDFPRSRPFTMRPENHLKQEGDIEMSTEKNEQLSKIFTEDVQRPPRFRRDSNLKLEGKQEFSTEKREQFRGYDLVERLPPARREGNLLLEGDLDFKTENADNYVANLAPEGADFRKRSSFFRSGGEFRSALTSPRRSVSPNRSAEGQSVRSKLIPFKTEHYGLDSEIVANCNRRNLNRNSKRLKENIPNTFDTFPRSSPFRRGDDGDKIAHGQVPPSDVIKFDSYDYSRLPRDTHTSKRRFDITGKSDLGKEEDGSDDTSDTASVSNRQPTFRLEVHNVDAHPQGFHRGNQRVFPPEGIPTETINFGPDSFLEEKRRDYYRKNVNSPEVPCYLLDKNNNNQAVRDTDLWDINRNPIGKLKRDSPGILDIENGKLGSPGATAEREPENWSRPSWLTT